MVSRWDVRRERLTRGARGAVDEVLREEREREMTGVVDTARGWGGSAGGRGGALGSRWHGLTLGWGERATGCARRGTVSVGGGNTALSFAVVEGDECMCAVESLSVTECH